MLRKLRISNMKKIWSSLFVLFLVAGCLPVKNLHNLPLANYSSEEYVEIACILKDGSATLVLRTEESGKWEVSGYLDQNMASLFYTDSGNGKEFVHEVPAGIGYVTVSFFDLSDELIFLEMIPLPAQAKTLQTYTDEDGNQILNSWVAAKTKVYVHSGGAKIVKSYSDQYPPASPPFSERTWRFSAPLYMLDSLNLDEYEGFIANAPAVHLINGAHLYIGDEDFPDVNEPHELAESLRYITTNVEYADLLIIENQKKKIDAFWMERSGNRDRARAAIKQYYLRVESANRYFTTYKPGWKTDKGMIWIVFGEPDKVTKDLEGETWQYIETTGLSSTFRFIAEEHDVILIRSASLKPAWDYRIARWRQGLLD